MSEQSIFKRLSGKTEEEQKKIIIDSCNDSNIEDKDYSKKNFKELIESFNEYKIFSEEEKKDILNKLMEGVYVLPSCNDKKGNKQNQLINSSNREYILSTKITINGKCISYFLTHTSNCSKRTIFIKDIHQIYEEIYRNSNSYFLKTDQECIYITKDKYEYILEHMSSTFQL